MRWVIKKGDRYLRFVTHGENFKGPYRIEESWDDPLWGVAYVAKQSHAATFEGQRPDDVVGRLGRSRKEVRCVKLRRRGDLPPH